MGTFPGIFYFEILKTSHENRQYVSYPVRKDIVLVILFLTRSKQKRSVRRMEHAKV